jgi:hypothetical protein
LDGYVPDNCDEVTGIWLENASAFGVVIFPHSQLLREVLLLYNP